MDLSLEQLERALSIRKRIAQLEGQLAGIFGRDGANSATKHHRPRKKMSAAGRARIAAAQKARWAKAKGSKSAPPKTKKRRGGLTPAGRKKLSQMMKARWAAKRKAAAKK
jgi:hypothetical protein